MWNFLAYGLSKAVVLFTLSILAHLLAKTDFGLVAVSMVAINYLAVFKDLGLGAALIQKQGNIEAAADTVFTLNLMVGCLLTILVFPIAPFVAAYFGDPQIIPILRWLGISFLINSLGAIHVIRLRRALNFRQKLIPDLGSAVIKGVISISMALSGFGIWSLVVGQLSGAATSAVLAWTVLPWRPKIRIRGIHTRALLKYGASVTGSDFIGVVFENLPAVIVGKIYGMALLGVYSLAYRLPEMMIISILWVIGGVIFPAFSAIQNHAGNLIRGFLTTIRLMQIVATPLCLWLIIVADPLIRTLFGEQWLDAIPLLQILAAYAWVYSIGFHVGAVYKSIGRPDILFKLSLFTLVMALPALLIGANFSLTGIALAQLIVIIIRRIIGLTITTRFIDVTLFEILKQLKPSLQCGFVLALIALPTLYLTSGLSPLIQLTVVIGLSAAAYLAALWLTEKENLIQVRHMFAAAQ